MLDEVSCLSPIAIIFVMINNQYELNFVFGNCLKAKADLSDGKKIASKYIEKKHVLTCGGYLSASSSIAV